MNCDGNVGCKCCKFVGLTSPFGAYSVNTANALQAVNFEKHQRNDKHKAAVICFINNSPDPTIGAPCVDEFKALADEVVHGNGTCNSMKRAKMTFCIAEGQEDLYIL